MQAEMTILAKTLKNKGLQVMIPIKDGINYFYVSNNDIVVNVTYDSWYREYKLCVEYKSKGQGNGCIVKDRCNDCNTLINDIFDIMENIRTKEDLGKYNHCVDARKVLYLISDLEGMRKMMPRQYEFEMI